MMNQDLYDFNKGTGVSVDDVGHKRSAVVFTPKDMSSKAKWPTLIFFHGAGEASSTCDINRLFGNGLPKLIKAGLEIPYIVIAMQDQWSSPNPSSMKYALDNTFLKKYPIDLTKIATTGLSYGGGASLAFAVTYPELISSVVSASTSRMQPSEEANLPKLGVNKIPVWFWYGTNDTTGPFKEDIVRYANIINSTGGVASITTEQVGHGPWDNLYTGKTLLNGKTIYNFFDANVKGTVTPPVDPKPERKLLTTIKIYDNGDIEKI